MITEMTRPQFFYLLQLKGAVELELKGMRHSSGRSACAQAKRVYKISGNREKVLKWLEEMVTLQRTLRTATIRYDSAYASDNKESLSDAEEIIQQTLEDIQELQT